MDTRGIKECLDILLREGYRVKDRVLVDKCQNVLDTLGEILAEERGEEKSENPREGELLPPQENLFSDIVLDILSEHFLCKDIEKVLSLSENYRQSTSSKYSSTKITPLYVTRKSGNWEEKYTIVSCINRISCLIEILKLIHGEIVDDTIGYCPIADYDGNISLDNSKLKNCNIRFIQNELKWMLAREEVQGYDEERDCAYKEIVNCFPNEVEITTKNILRIFKGEEEGVVSLQQLVDKCIEEFRLEGEGFIESTLARWVASEYEWRIRYYEGVRDTLYDLIGKEGLVW